LFGKARRIIAGFSAHMPPMPPSDPATARFKRRLASLAVIAAVGMAVLAGRVIWLQALQ